MFEWLSHVRLAQCAKLGAWLLDKWGALCSFVCPTAVGTILAFVDMDAEKKKWLIEDVDGRLVTAACGFLLLGGIAGLISTLRREPTLDERVADEREKMGDAVEKLRSNYTDMLDTQLSILSNALRLTDKERVSVYMRSVNVFVTFARYSRHPTFTERGRKLYPATEGVIARAWADGSAIEMDLPDPERKEAEYRKVQGKRCGMPAASLSSIRMRSRSYAAFAIDDIADIRRVAVIVFESTSPSLPVDEIRKELADGEARRIAEFINRYKAYEPDVGYAQQEGF
ncbi:hypothetical protein WMF28_33495 [Sorangium sp. So ce590]|uniref:hypothetical protein n=1 Tax=Sorangium sp. So ce590 TaxID=3133317 RepID=UPI003F6343C2